MYLQAVDQGGPSEADVRAWDRLVDALESFLAFSPKVADAIVRAPAGETIRPELETAYDGLVHALERLKQRLVQLIEGDQKLSSAVDATAPSVGFAGLHRNGLEAYFAEIVRPSMRIVEMVKRPLPGVGEFHGGFAGFGQIAQVAQLVARLAGPLWEGLIVLLRTPAVKAAGSAAVWVMGLGSVINNETESYFEYEKSLADMLASGAITVEQYDRLKKEKPSGPTFGEMVVYGAVGLGAFALLLKAYREDRHAAGR